MTFILVSFRGKRFDMPQKSRKRGGASVKRGLSAEHLNNVNAYHGRLTEWRRRFHGVATENLPNYLGWRRTSKQWDTPLHQIR